jgi:hypothetical protein
MPKFKANRFISNLSLSIPRQIHQSAKVKAIRSGAPSFASYVAMVLDQAPNQTTAAEMVQAFRIELLLRASVTGEDNAKTGFVPSSM